MFAQPLFAQPQPQQLLGRSPTFLVGSSGQKKNLELLKRREQHFSEIQHLKSKELCFNARSYQRTHPKKALKGQSDADATLCSPMLVGIADGVSQVEDFGIDASELPNELLDAVEELAVKQLMPDEVTIPSIMQQDAYNGPIPLMRKAYESTESLGSTTALLAVMDNSSCIHGKLHPMIAVLSIGDCEILILRRQMNKAQSPTGGLTPVFHSEMQRIDGHAQKPLQLARLDKAGFPDFDEEVTIEAIEKGSAVHCVSAYEGDVVVLGSDGVFDNLFIHEIVQICDANLPTPYPGAKFVPIHRNVLGQVARHIVEASHAKTEPLANGLPAEAPIGRGGKVDDTSCVVGQVVAWTEDFSTAWKQLRVKRQWQSILTCGGSAPWSENLIADRSAVNFNRNYPSNPNASFGAQMGSFSEYGSSFATSFYTNNRSSFSSNYSNHSSFYGNGRRPGRKGRRDTGNDADDYEDGFGCSIM